MALSKPGNPWHYPKGHEKAGQFAPKGVGNKITSPKEEYEMRNMERQDYTDSQLEDYIVENAPKYEGEEPSPKVRAAQYRLWGEVEIGQEADSYSAKDVKEDKKGKYIDLDYYNDVGMDCRKKAAEKYGLDADTLSARLRHNGGWMYIEVMEDGERLTDYEHECSYAEWRLTNKLFAESRQPG